ncbi:neprilysin-2-like [Ornithodoros turicata]|uniref:neprilysin-2-like n=1 Tax=Ornithodoros turicata TaxID=34597 RepID=UPI003139DC0F
MTHMTYVTRHDTKTQPLAKLSENVQDTSEHIQRRGETDDGSRSSRLTAVGPPFHVTEKSESACGAQPGSLFSVVTCLPLVAYDHVLRGRTSTLASSVHGHRAWEEIEGDGPEVEEEEGEGSMEAAVPYPVPSDTDASYLQSASWTSEYRACIVCAIFIVVSGAIVFSLGTYRIFGKPFEPQRRAFRNGSNADNTGDGKDSSSTCRDRECQDLARYIEKSLLDADPCDNFYDFVCSNWSYQASPKLDDLAVISEDVLRALDLEEVLLKELQSGTEDVTLSPFFDIWKWCRDLYTAHGESIEPFLKILYATGLSQFPLPSDGGRLSSVAGKVFRITGLAPLVKISLDPVDKVIQLDRPDTLFPDFVQVSNSHRSWYIESVRRAARQDYRELFNFEQDLVVAMNGPAPDENYTTLPLFKLHDAQDWSWEQFLKNALEEILPVTRITSVKFQPKHFESRFLKLLNNYKSEDVLNYLGFRVYLSYAPLLPGKRFWQMIHPAIARRPGWEWNRNKKDRNSACARAISRADPALASAIILRRLKNDHAEPILRSMLEHSKREVLQYLGEMAWVTSLFLDKLGRKYRKIRPAFFVPSEWRKYDFRLDQCRFFRCDTTELPLLEVFQKIVAQRQKRRFQNLKKPFPDYPSDVLQTECSLEGNLVFVPLGAINLQFHQDAFWKYHLPRMLVSFSEVLIDVFRRTVTEVQKRYADLHGRFTVTGECLRRQHSGMVEQVPIPLSSNATSKADLLDFMAVQAAFRTYKKFAASDVEGTLPGLVFNSAQLFFIHFALSRCEKYNSSYEEQLLRHGLKGPAAYRVNGPLRNINEFSQVFHCPPQTYMNPKKKCIF